MKYLKKINLKNFQSHKDTNIELDKGLNIIVGPSDTGKTAIIRGIKWVLYNEPSGDYFIREGETEASVTLEFSNGVKVKRLRTRSKNAYILYDTEGEEIVFEGFGTKVPQEIIDFISITKIPLDSSESNSINLGEQLEGAFLLSEKGSTRASAIGRLIGVNIIDDALKDTLRDVRNSNIKKKSINENIVKTQNELEAFDYLDGLQENIRKLDTIKEILDLKMELRKKLSESVQIYNNIKTEQKSLTDNIGRLSKISNLDKNISILEKKYSELKIYKKLNNKHKSTRLSIRNSNDILNKLKKLPDVEIYMSKIETFKTKREKLKNLKEKLDYNKKEKEKIKYIYNRLKDISYIDTNIGKIEDKSVRLKSLKNLSNKINSTYKSIIIGKKYIGKLSKVDEIDDILANTKTKVDFRDKLVKIYKNLNGIILKIQEQDKLLQETNKRKELILSEYEKLLETNGRCPFCLSEINDDKIKHIIDHHT